MDAGTQAEQSQEKDPNNNLDKDRSVYSISEHEYWQYTFLQKGLWRSIGGWGKHTVPRLAKSLASKHASGSCLDLSL